MKKPTAGKSSLKKSTVNPGKKRQPATVVQGRGEKAKLSQPTNPEKKDQRKHRGYKSGKAIFPKSIRTRATELRSDRVLEVKSRLFSILDVEEARAMEGDDECLILLYGVAMWAIRGIVQIQDKHPAMVKDFAKTAGVWPTVVTTDKKLNKLIFAELTKLELGTEIQTTEAGFLSGTKPAHLIATALLKVILFERRTQIANGLLYEWESQTKKKRSSIATLETLRVTYDNELKAKYLCNTFLFQSLNLSVVLDRTIMDQMSADAARLPELSEDTWTAWFEFAWKILLTVTSDYPERNEILAKIGAPGKTKHEKTTRNQATIDANVRDEISKAIKRSFKVCCNLKK